MRRYTQQELDRMGRAQLLQVIEELEVEIEECHMLLQDALYKIEQD